MADQSAISEREQHVLGLIENVRGRRAKFRDAQITMAHGAGGKATQGLIEGLFLPAFGGETLGQMADAGMVSVDGLDLALTTDCYVVRPLRFPGGSIGELAVNGTVNDLAVSGARPLALSLSLVLEEGLPADDLRAEVDAIAGAARDAGVEVVAGDTKVVERGHADGMYICTTGLGRRDQRATLAPTALRPGDRVILSGGIGEHGMAIMLARNEFELDASIESDTCSLWPAVDALLDEAGPGLRCMRDATRGGVASVLNELARAPRSRCWCVRATCRCCPRWRGQPRSSASTPCTSPTRASWWHSSPRSRPTRAGLRCARCRAASGLQRSERCAPSPRAWCWWRRVLEVAG